MTFALFGGLVVLAIGVITLLIYYARRSAFAERDRDTAKQRGQDATEALQYVRKRSNMPARKRLRRFFRK